LNHVLDNEMDQNIQKASIIGLCKLILHSLYSTRELVAKFLIAYFNPATESEISQILGIFFENLVKHKKQESLAEALILTLKTLVESPHDSPLREVKIEIVIRYVFDVTRPVFCPNGLNLHNILSMKLLEFMASNSEEKDVLRVVPKEMLTLEIGDDPLLKRDLIAKIDMMYTKEELDNKNNKFIKEFKSVLDGTYRAPLQFSSTAGQLPDPDRVDDENENEEDIEEIEEAINDKDSQEDEKDMNESEIISETQVELKECQVNVTILSPTKIENAEKLDESITQNNEESIVNTTVDDTKIEDTKVEDMNESSTLMSVNTSAVEFMTPKPKEMDSVVKRSVNKRQIFTPKTFESPLRKRQSGSTTAVGDSTMATPKTPNFSLPRSKASTPNTERQTRSRSKLETVQTRSKSANSKERTKRQVRK
jgi:hypothetical protein